MALSGKLLFTAAAVIVLCGASDERGKIACSAADEKLNFTVRASYGYGGHTPLFRIEGALELKPPGYHIAARSLAMRDEHLVQQWLYATDMRLQFYIPTKDGTVSFSVLTTMSNQGDTFAGTYDLEINGAEGSGENTFLLDGKITCKMD